MGQQLTLRVSSAALIPGSVAGSARLSVHATIQNAGAATVVPPIHRLFIRYGGTNLRPDAGASAVAGTLVKPLAPGRTAAGELYFEARGGAAKALSGLTQAAIRLGQQTLVVNLR